MSLEPGYERVYRRLVPVFHGSMGEVMALQASLGAQGFETIVDQEMTKTLDPAITGGGDAFNLTLIAAADRADEIGAALKEMRSEAAHRRAETPDDPDDAIEAAAPAGTASLKELEDCGRRVRWSSFCTITFPIGITLGLWYLALTWRRDPKPPKHGQTIVAFAICWIELAALFVVIRIFAAGPH